MPRSSPAGQGGAGDLEESASRAAGSTAPGVARRKKGEDGGGRQRQVGEQGSGHGVISSLRCRTMGRHPTSPPGREDAVGSIRRVERIARTSKLV
jgi:hypothetical protein